MKILYSTYAQADIDKVSMATFQLDKNQRKKLLIPIKEFQDRLM